MEKQSYTGFFTPQFSLESLFPGIKEDASWWLESHLAVTCTVFVLGAELLHLC